MSKQGYIQRYMLIIRLIRNNRYISLPELTRKVEDGLVYFDDTEDIGVSRRTILRDLKEIRLGLGISIEYSKAENGYYIPEDEDQISDIERILEQYDLVTSLHAREELSSFVFPERRKPHGTEHLSPLIHAIKRSLIGRGARYMPFAEPTGELPVGERKYDQDTTNRLRVLETLHYHSVSNPKYIHELRTAMVQTGIVAEKVKTLELKLKASFKETELYNRGYVFVNDQESYVLNEDVVSLGDGISNRVYKVHINSGRMSTGLIFGNEDSQTSSIPYRMFKFKDLGSHVIRAAINRSDAFKYSELKARYPNLKSVKEFVESPSYLAGINIQVYAAQDELDDMEQKNKLYCAVEVLKQIEPLLSKGGVGYKGSKQFRPEYVRDVFREKSQNFALDSSSDKEYGKSMKETENPELRMDLSCADWYAYEDCFGTSEEKYLIRYIESIYPKLAEKFDDIYLLRNEKDLKIYSFDTGEAYQPDYVLFLKKKNDGGKADYIQIFIEPKGLHLRTADKWKEDALGQIRENADILFPTQGAGFNVWGMPFFTESKRRIFEEAICDALGI